MRTIKKIYRKLKRFSPRERRKKAERKVRIDHGAKYYKSIKNKFSGQRGFVIGNGPSLRISDLDALQDEVCIASNKIYLAFDKTDWRPSFHTIVDALLWAKLKDTIGEIISPVLIPSYLECDSNCSADVKVFKHLGPAPFSDNLAERIPFSDDFSIGAYGGYSVTYENIQLAVHLGLNPIYIIGCDHFYAGEEDVKEASQDDKREQIIAAPETSNHFVKNYRQPGEIVSVASTEKMNISYKLANKFAGANNITLINATRGGFLEAFPRDDFDKIVKSP